MKSIIVDFSKIYIGTVAKQGEHNRTQLVFALPDDFAGADYINAEFKKSDNSDVVVEGLIPKDGFITIPLTQGLTNVCDQIDIQLVAYAVDGVEIAEIAKSSTVRGVIRPSLNILFNHDEPGIIERVIAFINAWTEKLSEMWNAKHSHENQTLLDSITPEMLGGEQADWDENDATEKSFVKNRTHWSESSIVSNDYTVDWLDETPPYSPQNWDSWDLGIELAEGIEYTIAAGDQMITGECTKIEVEAQTGSQVHLILGNLYYLNGLLPSGETYEDNGFPMLLDFATENGDNHFNFVLTDSDYFGSDLSFSIGKEETVYHPVDINYLPESAKDAVEMKHTHANKTILDNFSTSTAYPFTFLEYAGHTVPQFPINDIEPTTLSNDYTVPWLKPNVWHRFGSADSPVRSISILELQAVDNSVAEEYLVEFWTGATAPSPVIFPLYVKWPDGSEPVWVVNKHYQVSIVNNVGLWCETDYGEVEET